MFDKKEMFQATCSECGTPCEVPFKPTGGKPVLCSNCFGKQKDKHQGRSGDRQMFSAVCDKCGQKAEVPFKPTEGKPIFCNDCFSKESRSGGRRGDRHGSRGRDGGEHKQLSEQLKSLSNKLDKVISILETGAVKKKPEPKQPEEKKKVVKKAVKKKVKKVKKVAKKKK